MAVKPVSFQDSNLSMEDLLKESDLNVTNYKRGDIVVGKVVGFQPEDNPDSIIIGMSSKYEGKILMREFEERPHLGEEIEALVEAVDQESGLLRLSKRRLEQRRGWEIIVEAFETQIPISAVVKREMKQGYLVMAEAISLFLPHSHLGRLATKTAKGRKNPLIGSVVTIKILELNHKRKTGVVSRKVFQDEQNEQFWGELVNKVNIGDIVDGKVIKHTKVGALIEVEGVQGFLHKSNISWERHQNNFKEKLPLGSNIQVRVLEIDAENNRLSLGLKQLTEDPWEKVMEKVNIGDIVTGTVSFVARYGAFIEIGQGLEGLLHISEMSWTRKVNHAQEIVKIGEEISTKVIGVNAEDKRISLGLRQLQQNPWDTIRSEYQVGQIIKGKVKDITNFGAFISITDDIDALIRKEDINWNEPAPDPKTVFKKGEEVECKIVELNFEDRKIGCSTRHLLPNPYKDLRSRYRKGTVVSGKVTGIVDFGIFVRFEDRFEGLVHLSAMTKEQADQHRKLFKKGQDIKVVVRHIDPEKRKISLSLRDVENALERIEIEQYIDKESDTQVETSSPFSELKSFVFPKSV